MGPRPVTFIGYRNRPEAMMKHNQTTFLFGPEFGACLRALRSIGASAVARMDWVIRRDCSRSVGAAQRQRKWMSVCVVLLSLPRGGFGPGGESGVVEQS